MGGLVGFLIPFETKGLDLVLTALFLAIFLDQWTGEKQHIPYRALSPLPTG